jgi:hypothetical protein
MSRLAFLLKSHAPDFDHAQRMVESFNEFNRENIPLFIVVPEDDLGIFAAINGPNIEIRSESELGQYLVDEPVAGIRPGYINQEIVKLAFWELGLADNYFCVDSDAVFVRPFGADDFMFDETTPYTVLVEDNELKVEPRYYNEHWKGRETHLRHIQDLVGLNDRRLLTCHGHQVFSSQVLKSLKDDFMAPRGWSYRDLLAEVPYEFTWYNMWLQKSRVIPIEQREPLVKVFHHEGQHLEYALRATTTEDIARGYVAVVINSNFTRSWGEIDIAETPEETLARYVPYPVLSKALAIKARDTATRRLRG